MAERNYIPLSLDLLTDPKIVALQMRYGMAAGVGHWVIALLELYANGARPIDAGVSHMRKGIEFRHGLDEEGLAELCDLLADLGLVDPLLWRERGQLANSSVADQIADWKAKHERRVNAGRKGGKASNGQAML